MKLEDLPKRVNYKVPAGYFDKLPRRVQDRVASPHPREWKLNFSWAARYAIPLLILLGAGMLWYQQANNSIEDQLEKIEVEQLSFFIEESDLTSEELAQNATWTTDDLDALEQEVFDVLDAPVEELDDVVDELDLENL